MPHEHTHHSSLRVGYVPETVSLLRTEHIVPGPHELTPEEEPRRAASEPQTRPRGKEGPEVTSQVLRRSFSWRKTRYAELGWGVPLKSAMMHSAFS